MATAISVRIPAGKLGTVRVDRTIDVYSTNVTNDETSFTSKSATASVPTLALHRQLPKTSVTASPTVFTIDPSEEQTPIDDEHHYIPITKWIDNPDGNNNTSEKRDDEQMSDIAVIYSVVRHSSTRRTSSPKLFASSTPNSIARPQQAKIYTLEAPLTPIVSHASKQAQIKSLSSTRPAAAVPSTSTSYLQTSLTPLVPPSVRIQSSTSFTSHDRPSIPSVAIKPRPYSFRSAVNPSNDVSVTSSHLHPSFLVPPSPSLSSSSSSSFSTSLSTQTSATCPNHSQSSPSTTALRPRRSFRTAPRNAIERQISHITGRVSQLHDSFLARLSDFTSSTSHRQRNRSLTSLHTQAVNPSITLNESEQRGSNPNPLSSSTRHPRRSIKPRPKSETYDDHHRVNAAGSYAQLTLLGQPKANSTSTQKIIPAENPNGRIQYRSGTHHSIPERSNSTASSHSIQSTLDTKKARENYDRIYKQLEKAKADLERQRAKGPNHNPAKLAQIELQIRQYEQQVNDIRRRLTVIDPSIDTTAVKSRDENLTTRTSSFLENRTSTYGESTNVFSSNDDGNPPQDTNEPDDEAAEVPSKATVTSYDDIFQLVNTANWSALTVFLNFLLTDPTHEPNCLLFYIFTEELRARKAESRNEFLRWVFELHSTFTMNGSPLHIGLPQARIDSINRCLENQQQETNEEIKAIFNDAKEFARSIVMERELPDFNQKRTLGAAGRDVDFSLISKPHHFIEETLRSRFESLYKPNIEDWNSTKNSRELALVCSLATYLKRCDIKKCGNIPMEKIPKFFEREQRRLLVKLPRGPLAKKIKDHQLTEHQFASPTLCQVCTKPLWGIQYQGYLCTYCPHAFHRECASNSEKCLKDRKSNTLSNPMSGKRKPGKNPSSPTRTTVVGEEAEGHLQNDLHGNVSSGNEGNDSAGLQTLSTQDQSKNANLGRCASDRRVPPNRVPAKYRSNSNPQMGGNSIDELLGRSENEMGAAYDSSNAEMTPVDFTASPESANPSATEDDSDLEADVNSLPNLSDFIPADILQALYQSREWKLQTTINELVHTERTHLKGLKIMKKCFREPMEHSPSMSPVELDCIFRNLDQLIDLHSQFKYALRQHREEAKDHVVRHIGDLILKFLDGEKGEQFARACAYFIEDQSQALKLIKKKEQSPEFAQLMRSCEANPLCRRLTLKDYLPSVMTRFTKLKMLFEAMKKFVADDEVESEKLSKCVDRADYILKRMNHARMKKEQEALLKQIKANLEIQISNADKSTNLQNLQDCLEVSNHRLLYSGTLRLLPDLPTQKTEFECCLFTDIFVFFQKILLQPAEQRGIEDTFRYVLKEHQRDASNGRTSRPRTAVAGAKFNAPQNFILTPIIQLRHLLIKKKACGGARSFYVIDTDKKQLIEVEANSKDELEKWLEWIEKAREPFEKPKAHTSLSSEKSLNPSISSQSTTSLISLATSRSVPIEGQSSASSSIETTSLKSIEKESSIDENPELLMEAILEKDKELARVLQEKELLLGRLLNISPSQSKDSPGFVGSTSMNKANSSLEAITYASSCHNQLVQLVSQTQNRAAKDKKTPSVEVQSLWTPLTQLGEQLNLALKFCNQRKSGDQSSDRPNNGNLLRRNSSSSSGALTLTPSLLTSTSQTYSELKDSISMSSLHSAESLGSVMIPLPMPNEVSSSITDLDETIKSPISTTKQSSSPLTNTTRPLHVAREVVGRYDEGVFDDGTTSQNDEDETNSVIIADSDEDEIEHFDSTDSITVAIDPNSTRMQTCLDNSNNLSMEGQSMSLDVYEDEIYDNVKSNDSSRTNNPDNTNTSRFASEA